MFGDKIIDPFVVITILLVPFKKSLHFIIQEVANFFHDRDCVGSLFWVLTKFDKLIKKLIDIGEIKIAGKDKVTRDPVIEAYERMAGFDGIIAMGPIPKMSHQDFSSVWFIFLEPLAVTELLRSQVLEMMENALKYLFQVLGSVAALSADISSTGFRVKLYRNDAGSVLATVSHFFEGAAVAYRAHGGTFRTYPGSIEVVEAV